MTGKAQRQGAPQRLAARLGRGGEAVYIFVVGALAVAIAGLAAYLAKQPLLFPSLGPTVYLCFEKPLDPSASPRNTLIGHGVGLVVGYAALALFGLLHAPSTLQAGVTPARIGAATLAVALTGALLLLLRAPHPPAGATTLLVSLGLLATPQQLLAIAVGVVLLTVVCWLINRMAGVPVPPWRA